MSTYLSDYDYFLPEELIGQKPREPRDSAKLMLINRKTGEIEHKHFYNIIDYLQKGDVLVRNATKVIPARIYGHKESGGVLEVLLIKRISIDTWECLLKPAKKLKLGQKLYIGENKELIAELLEIKEDGNRILKFHYEGSFEEVLDKLGSMPLPPYITRKLENKDRYQTVYAQRGESVAAPTAGLHFTNEVLHAIDERGIEREELTLHVGAGTFKPVKSEEIEQHEMHTEYIVVHRHTLINLLKYDCNAIAVGTTSVRTLESLYYIGVKLEQNPDASEDELHVNQWEPYEQLLDGDLVKDITAERALQNILNWLDKSEVRVLHGSTQIIIAPGYKYKIVKMLITNFHQPQSTLLLLVSAFVNGDWKCIYDYALTHDFRFLSYGDSSLLIP